MFMDNVMLYDLIFLAVFCIWVVWFLSTRKHNLKREGWMYLYRTQWGVKFIDRVSKKYSKILHALKYPIVIVGFGLMAIMVFLLAQTVYIYAKFPEITKIVKAPPIMPLIPYFTQIFNVESFLPNFYFMYFLLALIIVAVVHEFSHGIYMRLFRTKIKSTGFAFLGPILGAFVEQDEKSFQKESRFHQMVVLGAGVFANILFFLLFFFLLVIFFYTSYTPSGYIFDNYAYNVIQTSDIRSFTEVSSNMTLVNGGNFSYVYLGNLSSFVQITKNINGSLLLYLDSPAIRTNLSGVIIGIDGQKVRTRSDLSFYLSEKKPGDKIIITTINDGKENNYSINLAENPSDSSKPFIGIVNYGQPQRGIFGRIINYFASFRDKNTKYTANYNPGLAFYLYNLLWWVMMINLFVALFNMLPLGILDGGRFFYLAVFGLTKSKKVAEKSSKLATKLIALIFLLMMVFWFISLF